MKKTYLKPAIEVASFIAEDIITDSASLLETALGTQDGAHSSNEALSDAYSTADSRLSVAE